MEKIVNYYIFAEDDYQFLNLKHIIDSKRQKKRLMNIYRSIR